MLKFHPITALVKTYAIFFKKMMTVLWFKYSFMIEFRMRIFDKMLLLKTVSHLKGYTTVLDLF